MVEGTQVGAYTVVQRIGEGGMGAVYLAEHTALRRRAAIKILHAEYSHRADVVARFFNEARAATAIDDPGIVQIFDFGQHTDGTVYLVMELLNGESLEQRLRRERALPISDVLRFVRQAASTLGAAHARGIVHRDLKPENLYAVRDPEVPGGERAKILDFGIAKLGGSLGEGKTNTQAVLGTPAFMSPEQCRGAGQVDHRSDLYSLGCVLYALLTGRPPFDAEGAGEIIAMHLRELPMPPSVLRGGVPPELDSIVMRCLAKDPAHRFQTAAELAMALDALAHAGFAGEAPSLSARMHAPMFTPMPTPPPQTPPTTLSSAAGAATGTQPPPVRRSRAGMFGVLGIVVAVGGVVGGAMIRNAPSPAAAAIVAAPPVVQPPPPAPPAPPQPPTAAGDAPSRALAEGLATGATRPRVAARPHAAVTAPRGVLLDENGLPISR
ncbi:MAG TPA: serine/threonine-protein kinase [Kofleriaceae bacterium]|jgi:serine/threonine-protein kinase